MYKAVKNLLSEGTTNSKTKKNAIKTYILYLAPSDVSGVNVCPFASEGCRKACLYSAGRGKFTNVQEARINKTKYWIYDRRKFYEQLGNELLKIQSQAKKENIDVAIRLNGTSDIDHLDLLKRYTGLDYMMSNMYFYDYTKNPNMIRKYKGTSYRLTFSRSECNDDVVENVLADGGNVAVVFSGGLPSTYKGYRVIDGDESDLRYFDPSNVVVGLKAKGDAKKDKSNFVI